MKRPPKFPLKFDKGIIFITRKRTTTEAMPAFKKFYSEKLRQMQMARRGAVNENKVQCDLSETIESLRKTGFDEDFSNTCRRDYQDRPRHRPRRKKNQKKKVDAFGAPESDQDAGESGVNA